MRIAINGFGRIGRTFLRVLLADPAAKKKISIAAINIGPSMREHVAHQFKYDTLMGTYHGAVEQKNNALIVDGVSIDIIAACDPQEADWKKHRIDWVVDCSGCYTKRDEALQHIHAGARYVLISAPAKGEDVAIIPGVNDKQFDARKDHIVSLGSCTTNAFIPLIKILHDAFIIEHGMMTTVHAYTNTQPILDSCSDHDVRRARAAALNIVPTSTGASGMIEKIFPDLAGRISGTALRVPVGKVSLIDFAFNAGKQISVDAIHNAIRHASHGPMKGIVDVTTEPLVSSDYYGNSHSVVVDALMTQACGSMGKVFGWYDNEWGYSERLKDFLTQCV